MKFYLVQMADGSKLLCSTQADAKSVSKEFTQFDIETDKDSLMAFAQDALNQIFALQQQIKALEAPDEAVIEDTLNDIEEGLVEAETVTICTADMRDDKGGAPSISHTIPEEKIVPNQAMTAMSVSYWLQDVATQAQIESVFQSLGARFGEAIRRDRV